jgi:surface polysaccharide O-acyltransferase-like enzyme
MQSEWIVSEFEGVFTKFGLAWGGFYFIGVFFAFRPTALRALINGSTRLAIINLVALILFVIEFRTNGNADGAMARKYFLIGGLVYQFFGALFLLSFFQAKHSGYGRLGNWLAEEGKHTFGIYLIHPMIIIFLIVMILPLQLFSIYTALPMALLLFFGSWVVSSVLTRLIGSFITGKIFITPKKSQFTKKVAS